MSEENIVEANTYKEPDPVQEAGLEQAREDAVAKQAPQFDAVATASQIFETYYPIYCKQLDKMSRKQLLRIAKAVLGLPLEEGVKPNVKNELEMQTYFVAERLHQSKMVLIQSVLEARYKKQLAETAAKEESKVEVLSENPV